MSASPAAASTCSVGSRSANSTGDLFRVSEGALVVGQPVENTLLDDGNDDLHPVTGSDRVAERLLLALDGADDEDVARHVSEAAARAVGARAA